MHTPLRTLATAIAAITAATLHSATITWDGGGADDLMFTANNWSTNTVPLAADDIVFAGTVRLTPLVSANFFTNSLTFSNTAGTFGFNGLGTLFIGAGGMTNNDADTMTFNCLVSANAPAVTFNAASGGLNFTNTVGLGANTLTLSGGSAITLGGGLTGSGAVTKIGTGALTLNASATAIGADLNLNAGVTTLAATGASQTFSGTSTTAIGAGSTFTINENMILDGGAQLTRASTGVVNLAAGKTLTVQGGSDVIVTGGYNQINTATINVTGPGSTFTMSGSSAFRGGSTLNITAGGSVSNSSFIDLAAAAGSATVLVDGTGSSFASNATVASFWGRAGSTATVTFSNGGTGNFGSGVDIANLGAGSVGTVSVQSGSTLTVGSLQLANTTNAATAMLTVNGAGSLVDQTTAGANLIIGAASGSAGTLNVQNSGTFSTNATGTTTVNATGAVAITGGTFNASGNITLNGGQLTRNISGTFALAAGKALTVQGGGDAIFTGSYDQYTAATITVTGAGSTFAVELGSEFRGGSTLNITSGGSFSNSQYIDLARVGGNATVLVDGVASSFSSISPAPSVWGESGGTAAVMFSNGGSGNFGGGIAVAKSGAGSVGTVNVQSGSTLTLGSLELANTTNAATATLTVNGAGSLVSQTTAGAALTIGATFGSVGTLNVESSGAFSTNSTGTTTVNRTGAINITGGTFNANGNVNVNGGTITRFSTNGFNVATGKTLSILNGGDVNVTGQFFTFGTTTSVAGTDSTLTATTNVYLQNDPAASITAGGRIEATNSIILDGVTMTVDGAGSVLRTTTGNSSTFGTNGGDVTLTVRNGGSVDLGQLELAARSPGGSDVVVSVLSGAILNATQILAANNGSIANSANVTVDGPGSMITVGFAGLTLGATTTTTAMLTVQNGGSFASSGGTTLNATGTLTINAGTANLGTLTWNGGALNFNSGALTYTGNLTIGTGGLLGTALTLGTDRQLTLSGTTTIDAFRTLTLNGGTLRTGSLVNNGTLDFQHGTLGVTGAGGLNIGTGALGSNAVLGTGANLAVTNTLTVAGGASLALDGGGVTAGALSNAGFIEHARGALNITGAVTNAAGAEFFAAKPLTVGGVFTNQAGAHLTLQNGMGRINGAGNIANAGLIAGDGTIAVGLTNNATGDIRAEAGRVLNFTGAFGGNSGDFIMQGGTLVFSGAVANNATGYISGRGALHTGGLTNNGVMAFSAGSADIRGDVTNAAGARIVTSGAGSTTTFFDDLTHNGAEIFTGAGASTVIFGALSGAGPFTGTGTVYSIGDLRPGNSPATVSYGGSLVLGNGTLTMELGGLSRGTQYDSLNIAGSFYADGILSLSLFGGYSPVLGDKFDLYDAASITGTFDALLLPALAQYLTWETSDLYSTGTVEVSTTLTPIEQWRLLHFGSPANSGDGADNNDFDKDGAKNLLEYALGLDPKTPNVAGLPTLSVTTAGATNHIALTITRPLSATDISYQFEVGGSLAGFLPGSSYSAGGDVPNNANTTQVSRTDDGTFETIVVRDNTPITAATQRFLRLKISNP